MLNHSGNTNCMYHVILTITRQGERVTKTVRILGTYTTHLAAKKVAQNYFVDVGYSRDMFSRYHVRDTFIKDEDPTDVLGRLESYLYGVTHEGAIFQVDVNTARNNKELTTDSDDGLLAVPLYFVVRATLEDGQGEDGLRGRVSVEGSFASYEEARDYASKVRISPDVPKEEFWTYDEAEPDKTECGYGDNVVLHAVTRQRINSFVMVIGSQDSEEKGLKEASITIL
ncbi:hypothetical protein BDW59DRAFT_158368 [Aspergillus cavernicola]|uniref:Uncharacterized protein n=1 Tax=Aspergillus cavernicola TaxID=176166 RepID=A0ABR4IUE5_9EURO